MGANKGIKEAGKRAFLGALHALRRVEMAVAGTFFLNRKKVVFSAFRGTAYGDNPRAISEKLHEMCPQAEIVWLFQNPKAMRSRVPEYVRVAGARSFRAHWELGSARVWVDNFTKREYLRVKRGKQFYINTWHGDRAFKTVVYLKPQPPQYKIEENCDLMVAGARFGAEFYRQAFRYRGEIMVEGYPRNDLLVENDPRKAEEVRRKLRIPAGKKLLLYAPTFREENRESSKRQAIPIDLSQVLTWLNRRPGEEWLLLFRAHYYTSGLEVGKEDKRLIDVSGYPEMAELLLLADALITDYSTCAPDFSLLGRPILLYQADREEYRQRERSLYLDALETPYHVAMTPGDLEKWIEAMDFAEARENCRQINQFYGTNETGRASEAVCRYIIERLS